MKLSRAAIAAYIVLVFLCGAVLGAFSFRLYTVSTVSAKSPQVSPNPEQFRKNYLATMRSRLTLSDDQVTRLNLILDDTRARIREVHDRSQPEVQEIRKEQTDKIRALLSAGQRSTYEEMLKQREQRQKEKGGHGGGPGF
jgi:Spy/CpxP family protein refolding chaperone